MGSSADYPDVAEWTLKDTGYHTGDMVRYRNNIFRAAYGAGKEPGVDPGWSLVDELYDQAPPAAGPPKIIAYIPTWRRAEGFNYGNPELYKYITHGIIAFLMFNESGAVEFDPKSVADTQEIVQPIVAAAHPAGTYVSVAVGGATDYAFLNLLTAIGDNENHPSLDAAVQLVARFVHDNGLDGVDLDLECWWDRAGDASKDQGGRKTEQGPHPAGKALALFAKKLKAAMPGKLVSAAVFATSWYGNNYDPSLADHVDWLGVMSYDLTGSWNVSPVGPHTALFRIRSPEQYIQEQQGEWPRINQPRLGHETTPQEDNPISSVEEALWYWSNPFYRNWQGSGQKVPRGKLSLGVPLYGYDFAFGKDPDDLSHEVPPGYKSIRYKDILRDFPDAHEAPNANIKVPGSTPRPPFIQAEGQYPFGHNIYLETPFTANIKVNFGRRVGTQGVIIWELSNDVWEDGKSIIKALYGASGNVPIMPIESPPPVEIASRCLWDCRGFAGFGREYQFKYDALVRPGVQQFSSRLWNIPDGADWKSTAKQSPAVIKRQYFNRPTRIKDLRVEGLWGEFDVRETSGVPDWFWGNVDSGSGAPPGVQRFKSRIIGPTGDWVDSVRQTPALICGEYFDQPTTISEQGLSGVFGHFDVSDTPSTLLGSGAHAQGPSDYCYCKMNPIPSPGPNVTLLNLTSEMTVAPGTPYLHAVLTGSYDSVDFPAAVVMTIQDPNGTYYDHDIQDGNQLVIMAGPSVRSLIVKDPKPGEWTITISAPPGVGYHCHCGTVPSKDVYDTVMNTAGEMEDAGIGSVQKRDSGRAYGDYYFPLALQSIVLAGVAFAAAGPIGLAITGALEAFIANALFGNTDQPSRETAATIVSAVSPQAGTSTSWSIQQTTQTMRSASAAASSTPISQTPSTVTFEAHLYNPIMRNIMRYTSVDAFLLATLIFRPRPLFMWRIARIGNTALNASASPWVLIRNRDNPTTENNLYVDAFSTAANPNPNNQNDWMSIPGGLLGYPESLTSNTISRTTIMGALQNAGEWTENRGRSITLQRASATLIMFFSEGARFALVGRVLSNLLGDPTTHFDWNQFRELLLSWSLITSRRFYRVGEVELYDYVAIQLWGVQPDRNWSELTGAEQGVARMWYPILDFLQTIPDVDKRGRKHPLPPRPIGMPKDE